LIAIEDKDSIHIRFDLLVPMDDSNKTIRRYT